MNVRGSKGCFWAAIFMVCCFLANPGWAQEEDYDFSFGAVKEASETRLVLIEFDFEQETEIDVVYEINEQTVLENITSVNDIVPGDELDIQYQEQDGKNIAKVISKNTEMYEDDDAGQDENMEDTNENMDMNEEIPAEEMPGAADATQG